MVQPMDNPDDVEEIDEPEYRPRRSTLYSVLIIFAMLSGVIFASIMYTNRVAEENNRRFEHLLRESNQKWCGIIGTFDDAYKTQPPMTETGRVVAFQIHQLRIDYGC